MKTDKLDRMTARTVHIAVHNYLTSAAPAILDHWRFTCLIVPVDAAPALRPFKSKTLPNERGVADLLVDLGALIDGMINPPEVRERQAFIVMAIPLDDDGRLAVTNAADDDALADSLADMLATIKRGNYRNV